MADTTSLGDRMKQYEQATRMVLPRRTYTIIRADGKAFHSYLRHAEKPFDTEFMTAMDETAAALCQEMSGSVFAYVQSDEISVLLTDFGSVHSEPWFGGSVQKMASVAAAAATAALGARFPGSPLFDARVFTIPSSPEVANYFTWRQRDCIRNSISMTAQAHFSQRELHGLNTAQMQEILFQDAHVNWALLPDGCRRGRVIAKVISEETVSWTDKSGAARQAQARRSRWESLPAPRFAAEPDSWLAHLIPPLPSLTEETGEENE